MYDLYSLKSELELIACPRHGKYPTITVSDGGLRFKTCCDEFIKELDFHFKKLIGDKTVSAIGDALGF